MRILTLVGLSGAGKSTVGALLAERQGGRLVDVDREIVDRARRRIDEIFESDGEQGFRRLEREALDAALASAPPGVLTVLVPGGGAPCQAGIMDRLLGQSLVVWMRVSPEEAARRLTAPGAGTDEARSAGKEVRPLVGTEDEQQTMQALAGLSVIREIVYSRAHAVVDVDGLDPEAAADAVEAAVAEARLEAEANAHEGASRTLHVELGERSYPIHLVPDLPGFHVARAAVELKGGQVEDAPILLVTDTNVRPLYAGGVARALEDSGFRVDVAEVPAGELSKTLGTASGLVDRALAFGLGRQDLVVALGGGVVGDLAGFVAAVLHRGVRFLQVPTTLLAQVDSAVGGKTGVNHPVGKNLIGAFWQPSVVISSSAVLETLPERERRCGLAEALKHGLLGSAPLAAWIEERAEALVALEPLPTLALVEACCRIKAAVVAEDEREAGRRRVLNLGHTFGHAYERAFGYGRLTHGEAVALGMVLAARLSERLDLAPKGLERKVRSVLGALGLPRDPEADGLPSLPTLLELARSDKKAVGETVAFVLLPEIGTAEVWTLTFDSIRGALDEPSPDPGGP